MMSMPVTTRSGDVDPGADEWLSTVLRPVGELNQRALRRLVAVLDRLTPTSDAVILNLAATQVTAPRAVARSLRPPARAAQRAGRCLLLVGAPPALVAELDRAGVPVTTLPAELLPHRPN
jgi:hypothetical protein